LLKKGSAGPDVADLLRASAVCPPPQIISAALKIGLFDACGDGPWSGRTLARRLQCSQPALERLLQALAALGLLRRSSKGYWNSEVAEAYLRRSGPGCLAPVFTHAETLQPQWSQLDRAVLTGTMAPIPAGRRAAYQRQLKRFLDAMHAIGTVKCELILKRVPVGRYRTMLDLGGGMGTYAAGFARRNRRLRAVVCDLPDVVRHARAYVRRESLEDRVTCAACHCLEEPLPRGPFDLVLLSNLLHIYGRADCRRLIKKAVRVLAPGGTLLVHEYLYGCGDTAAVGLFDMTMLVGTPGGRCFAVSDVEVWMRAAGACPVGTAPVMAGTSVVWGEARS
jgi:hypothetical protein